jgi:hypothetical protein
MSRAFVREDAGDHEPEMRFSLPPRDHASYPAAAALALLDAAYAGQTSAGELGKLCTGRVPRAHGAFGGQARNEEEA